MHDNSPIRSTGLDALRFAALENVRNVVVVRRYVPRRLERNPKRRRVAGRGKHRQRAATSSKRRQRRLCPSVGIA